MSESNKVVSIVDKVFSPYESTITMHPLIYEDLQAIKQSLIKEMINEFNKKWWATYQVHDYLVALLGEKALQKEKK